jgi:uncharacterized protein YkwD
MLLVVKRGAAPLKRRLIEDELSLGSDPQNGLVISNPTVSRRHALIRRRRDGRGWEILDLRSTNGTLVNGRRVSSSAPIAPGDRIMLGGVQMELSAGETPRAEIMPVPVKGKNLRIAASIAAVLAVSTLACLAYFELRTATPTATGPLSAPSPLPVRTTSAHASSGAIPPPTASGALSSSGSSSGSLSSSRNASDAGASAAKPWLQDINFFRSLAKLQPVSDNPALSQGDFEHARYLVKNFADLIRRDAALGLSMHTESPDRPWYTAQGLKAAQNSDVEQWYDPDPGARRRKINPIDDWIKGPFHRLSILDPTMREAGFGAYCENGVCASALELPHHWTRLAPGEPVMFPPSGATIPFSRMVIGEWPDPLASCPGYGLPAGLAITLQLGIFVPAILSAHSLTLAGAAVEHCAFDARTYVNPNPADQEWGRKVLAGYGAIVLIPRFPLRPGATYAVAMTVGEKSYTWSFTVGADGNR